MRTAFQSSTGRPDVVIAVLDSGIEWNNPDAMFNLRRKVHLNQGELPAPWVDPNMASLDPSVGPTQAKQPPPTASSCQALASSAAKAMGAPDATTGVNKNPNGVYDLFANNAFNVTDYACDPRVAAVMSDLRRVGPKGMLTPQDLILAFGDCKLTDHQVDATVGCTPGKHYDNDGNGYANDIAGWNFVDNNNDPFDDVQYGHGTGEARDSNAEAQSVTGAGGSLGTCPNCEVMPLRVGESFIADVNRFALASLYATDQGVDVIQEALGTLNNSTIARQAIEYAYHHGTTVIASAADEAAEHHNLPGVLPDTIVVNSVTQYTTETEQPHSYLQFNGCTDFGSRIIVSVESVSCSSEATGKSAGVAGLIYSAALNEHETASSTLPASSDPATDCQRPDGSPCIVTPNEVRQLMGSGNIAGTIPETGPSAADGGCPATPSGPCTVAPPSSGTTPADAGTGGQADDIDFADAMESSCSSSMAPNCTDPNRGTAVFNADQHEGAVAPVSNSRRYPAIKGWDEFYGYGRLNSHNAVSAAAAGTIPPEADITSPDWFQQINPASPTLEVDGHTFARDQSYTCELDVAPGGQPNNAMTTDSPAGDFTKVSGGYCDGSTTHTGAYDGALGSISIAALEKTFPANVQGFNGNENGGLAQTSNGRPNTLPYAFTARVVVRVAAAGAMKPAMTGEDRRQMFLHRDQNTLNGHFPMELKTDGASSPLLVDLEGSDRNDLILATSDGVIHAYRSDGSEAPGWPVHTEPLPIPDGERAFAAGGVASTHYAAVLGGVAAADLFHDGEIDVVADDNQGNVWAWNPQGRVVFHQSSNPAFSGAMQGDENFVRKGPDDRTEHGFFASPVVGDLSGTGKETDIIAAAEDRHLYVWRVWQQGSASPAVGSAPEPQPFPLEVYDHSKAHVDDPTTGHLTFDANASAQEDQGKIVDTPALAYFDGPGKPPSIVLGTNEEYSACATTTPSCDEGPANFSPATSPSLAAVGQAGVLSQANTRLYAISSDGTYRPGWPVRLGIVTAGLLPDVAEGVTGPPVVATMPCAADSAKTEPVVGAQSYAGPGYLFNGAGQSCLGSGTDSSGKTFDNALATDYKASNSDGTGTTSDTPIFPSVGNPAFGNINGHVAYLSPASGLLRALDAAIPEYQTGGQDFLSAWNTTTGQFEPGFPAVVNDLSFLTGPVLGDVLAPASVPGSDSEQLIGGTASQDLQAFQTTGTPGQPASSAWPKLTGDWTVATPVIGTFGTLDTASTAAKDVVSITRSGTLTVYSTPAAACAAASWPRYHHDNDNSGDLSNDAVEPGLPLNVSLDGAALSFTAPGNDLLCGKAGSYQVVTSASPITAQSFAAATPVALPGVAPGAAGTKQTITLPGGLQRYVALRAVGTPGQDTAGNVGLPVSLDTATGTVTSGSTGSTGSSSGSGSTSGGSNGSASSNGSSSAGVTSPAGSGGVGRSGALANSVTSPSHPAAGVCLSRRQFTIHLPAPRGQRLVRARVYVNGRSIRVLSGRGLRSSVNLHGLPAGTVRVKIVARTNRGHIVRQLRTYHPCTHRAAARHRPVVHHKPAPKHHA